MIKKNISLILLFYTFSWGEVYYFAYGEKVYLNKLKEQRAMGNELIKYYENQEGQKMGVKKEILVKCKISSFCEETFKKYDFKNIKKLTSSIFLITSKSNDNIFELSQRLYFEEEIISSHPNFIKKYQVR